MRNFILLLILLFFSLSLLGQEKKQCNSDYLEKIPAGEIITNKCPVALVIMSADLYTEYYYNTKALNALVTKLPELQEQVDSLLVLTSSQKDNLELQIEVKNMLIHFQELSLDEIKEALAIQGIKTRKIEVKIEKLRKRFWASIGINGVLGAVIVIALIL